MVKENVKFIGRVNVLVHKFHSTSKSLPYIWEAYY